MSEIRKFGYEPDIAAQFTSLESLKTAVIGGMGVGILYRARLENEIKNALVTLIDVPELTSFRLQSFIICCKLRQLFPIAKQFIALLRQTRQSVGFS